MSEFGTPSALASFPAAASSSSASPHIRIGRVYGSEETQAVAAVQGGAVWLYDVTSSQAITSFTVPPSTVFQTCPLSYHPAITTLPSNESSSIIKRGKQRQRYTAVGVAKGETISNDQQGKVLWVWKGEEVFEQVTVQLTHTIDILVRIPESHSMLVASSSGLSVVSSDLTATPIEFEKPSKTSQLIKVLFLGRIFHSGSQVVNCGLVFDNGQVAFISIKGVDEEQDCGLAEGLVRDTKSLPAKTLSKGEKVADAFMDDKTLNVHFLTSKGTMIPNAMSLRVDSDIVPTTTFTLNKPANVKTDYSQSVMASIPDTAGPLLVYATPTTSDSCSLVLFEPTYPAVLTHRPIGSQSFNVRSIVPLSNNLFTLISSTTSGDKWSIHTVDLTAPVNGVGIAQLLDSGALTTRYFSQQTMAASTKAIAEPNATATQDDALLDSLRSALFSASNQDSAPALDVWNTWSRVQDHPFTRRRADRTRSTLASSGLASRGLLAGQVMNVVLEGALPRSARQERAIEGQDAAASLSGSNQAETWLTTGPQGPYLQNVVTELIENGWANDGMWSINMGGLVKGALLVLGDWDNIMLACERLPLIPSPSLVSLLWHVLEYHHRQSDSGTTKETGLAAPPSLVDFLKAYITIPISPAMHKASLKSGLTRVEDVQAVLEVLVGWLEEVGKMEESRGFKWSESVQQVPDKYPVDRLVLHTQLVLDAHLALLVSHPPAHHLLQRLKTSLDPLVSSQSELVAARGLVEGFVRLAGHPTSSGGGGGSSSRGGKKGSSSSSKAGETQKVGARKMAGDWIDPLYSVDEIVI